ncbi:MAG: HlyD family type I secretion periplasmic adaptor subunit [Halioglobus sp.]
MQALEKGRIMAIHVEDGQFVQEGEQLVTLDRTQTAADETRLADDLHSARTEWLRARAFQYQWETEPEGVELAADKAIERAAAELEVQFNAPELEFHARLLQAQREEYLARHRTLDSQQQARQGELRQARSLLRKLQRTLPLIAERADSVKALYQRGLVSREQHLALEQERIVHEQDLLAEAARVAQLRGELEAVKQQAEALSSEYRRDNLTTLLRARQQAMALQQEWIKARERNSLQILVAPATGTVTQLAIHTVGGVVTPAQELLRIVPEHSYLEVEALVLNRDIGFVAQGQAVEVKVDTFNFTRYGTLEGR